VINRGFLSNLFRSKESKEQANENIQNGHNWNEWMRISRDNGTQLIIKPQLDRDGRQVYKDLTNEQGFKIGEIPAYSVYQEKNGMLRVDSVYINMPKEALLDQTLSYCIGNILLTEERLNNKVLRQYKGYAGEIAYNPEMGMYDKFMRQEIITSFEHEARVNQQRAYEREQISREEQREMGHEFEQKTSHAQRLEGVQNPVKTTSIAYMNKYGISDDRGRG